MPQFVKMGIGTQGYMPKQGASLRAQAKRRARRITRPGFPKTEPFRTNAEIDHYFSGEVIECLLCGRLLKRLARHLPRIHGIGEDAYRKRFGLPWRRGLTGSLTHTLYMAAGQRNEDRMRILASIHQPEAVTVPQRPKTPIQIADATERIMAINRKKRGG